MMTCINVVEFVLISQLEKDHSMIETRCLKNVVTFIISFGVLLGLKSIFTILLYQMLLNYLIF